MYIEGISIQKENIAADHYIASLPVVKHFSPLELKSPITFFVGENGTGKSTLIEAIAVNWGFNAEGGSINFGFSTSNTHSDLHQYIKLQRGLKKPKDGYFLRAETFYNVATNIDEMDALPSPSRKISESYGGKSLHHQSHGESFMSLALQRFGGNGLYILDEPEAALSPLRQMTLLSRMHELVGQNSQFIIATHSPILMAYPGAAIYELKQDGTRLTPYKETEHYNLTARFLSKPEQMLKHLLE